MKVRTRRRLVMVGRVGYAAKGLVFACAGLLSAAAALRGSEQTSDLRDVLRTIAQQTFGHALLLALIAGLVCYVIWRLLVAVADAEGRGYDAKGLAMRMRSLVLAGVYGGLTAAAVKTLLGGQDSGGTGGDPAVRGWTARALGTPLGQWSVGLAGLAVLGAGVFYCVRAGTLGFEAKLDLTSASERERRWILRVCAFGIAARGLVFLLAGLFLMQAAWQSNPAKARGLWGALNSLHEQPFGRWLFAVVAAGLAAYGLYACVKARYGKFARA